MRKRFQFSLQRILAIRRLEERMKRNLFLQAQAAFFAAEESKKRAEHEQLSAQKELGRLRALTTIPVQDCLQVEALIEDLKNTIKRRTRIVEARQAEMEKTRAEYLAASTRRKALEKLREARQAKHRKELKTAEGKRFDSIATERAYRRQFSQQEEQ